MMPETKTTVNGSGGHEKEATAQTTEEEHDPHFVPIVYLPEVHVPTLEEHEDEMVKLKAKLFRFDNSCEPAEWKERGTGEIKLLRHRIQETVRVVMRRDKTLKICANHLVASWMELKPNCGSERAWVWSVAADYADEEPKAELLAARFANSDDAKKFYDAFEEAKKMVKETRKPEVVGGEGDTSSESEEEEEEEDDSGLGDKSEPSQQSASKEASELADQLSKVTVQSGAGDAPTPSDSSSKSEEK